jgi:hypothetical protein
MSTLSLRDIFHRIVGIGEAADRLAHALPGHRCAMHLRDLATGVENAIHQASAATLKRIASS